MNVKDLMTRDVRSCRPQAALEVAARIMWEEDCGAVPVTDDEGCVVGMLTDRDVCMAAYTQGRALRELPVHIAMAREVRSVGPNTPLEAAERVMQEHQVRRLPVVDGEDRLVGILSLNDIALRGAVRGREKRERGDRALDPEAIATTLAAVCAPHHDGEPLASRAAAPLEADSGAGPAPAPAGPALAPARKKPSDASLSSLIDPDEPGTSLSPMQSV